MSVKNPVSDLKDNNYLLVKATLSGGVFRADLKVSRDDAFHNRIPYSQVKG